MTENFSDEEDLFDDLDTVVDAAEPVGDLPIDSNPAPDQEPEDIDPIEPVGGTLAQAAQAALDAAPPAPMAGEGLTGVEQFLTDYGVQGGIISFEDGESSKFEDLAPSEQAEILKSLVSEAVPSIEEKYNLDQEEINLLNVLRENDQTPEEFINNIVDYRLQAVLAQKDAGSIDFDSMGDDAVFVRQLQDNNAEMSADEIASELELAKKLATYSQTVGTMRNGYKAAQDTLASQNRAEEDEAFLGDLELQRAEVVQTVEGIVDVAGAPVTDEMKEYLLHDIMELNSNRDPILMEKVFSSPEQMFKTNWFLSYGEDYIKGLNDYWKKEVSKASKNAYGNATRHMPGTPTAGQRLTGPGTGGGNTNPDSMRNGYGDVYDEEDLFE